MDLQYDNLLRTSDFGPPPSQDGMMYYGNNPNPFAAPATADVPMPGQPQLLSIDGDLMRRRMNMSWMVLGAVVMFVMIYFAFAALTDRPPFSVRYWMPGGRRLPDPIERALAGSE